MELEGKIKKFDWKEWTPLVGLYFAPKHITNDTASRSLDKNPMLNGIYHGLTICAPILYSIPSIA